MVMSGATMVVMPLVFISILSAVIKLHDASSSLGKISAISIGTLLGTTAIAAFVGVMVTQLFGLTATGLVQGEQENARLDKINADYVGKVTDINVPDMILSFIPNNPFRADRCKSNIHYGVVIFATFLGIAGIQLIRDDSTKGYRIVSAVETLQAWIMKLVRLVMTLTPYGVFALITKSLQVLMLRILLNLVVF